MTKKLHALNWKLPGIAGLALISLFIATSPLKAQESPESEQLKLLRSDVGIVGLTGNLHWYNHYSDTNTEVGSSTELQLEFQNVRMLSSHVGIGFKVLASAFVNGFFEDAGFGESGIGPILRYYPLDSKRWQPYLQAGSLIGYNLSPDEAPQINNDIGVGFRTNLQGGLTYRVSNAFGIFLEAGPAWDYNSAFTLDSRALQINIGIELFRFN